MGLYVSSATSMCIFKRTDVNEDSKASFFSTQTTNRGCGVLAPALAGREHELQAIQPPIQDRHGAAEALAVTGVPRHLTLDPADQVVHVHGHETDLRPILVTAPPHRVRCRTRGKYSVFLIYGV